jgi:hypothetical protein
LADLVGDDERGAYAATNIAMCYGRTGRYRQQAEWSGVGLRKMMKPTPNWRLFRAHHGLGWSRAMLGDYGGAIQSADQVLTLTVKGTPWLTHAGRLLSADIYRLCGENLKSLAIADEALSDIRLERIGHSYAGLTGRWLSIAAVESNLNTPYEEALQALVNQRHTFDAMDQAELLVAWTWMMRRQGKQYEAAIDEERDAAVAKLPPSVALEFARLGFS